MNITIIGTGGVGGYFGGKLAQAGNNVTFIARGEHLKQIREKGLQIKSIKGDFLIKPAMATDNISEIDTPELVILGVKAWQVKDIAVQLKPLIKENTIVLPLQNGVLAADELLAVLQPNQVLAGLCRIFSKIEAPGIINHFGVEPEIVFGEMNNGINPNVEKLQKTLESAHIKSKIAGDIRTELWKKLMIIGSGGLLALTRTTYGEIRENSETRELMRVLLKEIYEVALADGAKIEIDFTEKTMAYIDTYPYDATTSLARDICAGKPSEIDYQNGTVARLGEQFKVGVPLNSFVYSCLLPLERKARKV
ncbi:MAG: 2-dehydropantoate 2-reductase [Bacteroidales bacterium]|nr:2-dehydropantoate 2-reductase [Bacteroidales bacterium]